MQTRDVSFKLQDVIRRELRPSERSLWSSTPSPGRLAKKALPLALFAIPWTAFSLFWIAGASGFKMPDFQSGSSFFPLFGIPFVLIGLGLLSAPYWAARKAASSACVITNERAILLETGFFGGISIRSFLPRQLSKVRRVQFADGSGDLIFDTEISVDGEGHHRTKDIGFFGISDVQDVERLILSLSKSSSK